MIMNDKRVALNLESDVNARRQLGSLEVKIADLERKADETSRTFSGLIDLESSYTLIEYKLQATVLILGLRTPSDEEMCVAKEHARHALILLDKLNRAELSLDQKDLIKTSDGMGRVRGAFADVILSGGGPLFDTNDVFSGDVHEVGRLLEQAIEKHCPLEHEFDIEPGNEQIIESERMILPRSQAVLLINEELVPALKKRLAESPGDQQLQKRIKELEDASEAFTTMEYFPQARPPSFEKDIMTAKLAGFTDHGEPLVTVNAPILKGSGNRLDRLKDMIKAEVVRGVAGTGLHPEADEALGKAQSAASGNRGSWVEGLSKLDTDHLYATLSLEYPFLKRIEDEQELNLLADLGIRGELAQLSARVHALMVSDRNLLMASQPTALPTPDSDEKEPSDHTHMAEGSSS